ncbi:MAG: aroma-sacti cluster domain-containing protein [Candidatus Korobacteraceae bacterium]|jgi:hypothetical protein
MTNVEQLQQAGVIPTPNPLTPAQVEAMNNLSSAEVDALISVHTKLVGPFKPIDFVGTCF